METAAFLDEKAHKEELVYLAMTVFRAMVMFGVLPLFGKSQYGYGWKEALVISWGGLRGAVGLALAVAVSGDSLIVDCDGLEGERRLADEGTSSSSSTDGFLCSMPGGERFKQVVLFHCSMTVMLTLLINAPTTGPILKIQPAEPLLKAAWTTGQISPIHPPYHAVQDLLIYFIPLIGLREASDILAPLQIPLAAVHIA